MTTQRTVDVPTALVQLISRDLFVALQEILQKMRTANVETRIAEVATAMSLASMLFNMLNYCLPDTEAQARFIAAAQKEAVMHFADGAVSTAAACGLSLNAIIFPTNDIAHVTCPACISALAAHGKQ